MKIRYIGSPRGAAENQEMMKRDIAVTVAVSTLFILGLTFLFFRRRVLVPLGLLSVGFGGLLASGLFSFLPGGMSAIAAGFGGALVGIAVDYATYFSYRYDNYDGLSAGPEALGRHLSGITAPWLIGAATTLAAFLCLLLSSLPGQRQLGLFAALGVGGAALFSFTVLPQLYPLSPPRRKKALIPLADLWGRFFEWQNRHTALCASVLIIVSLVCALGLAKVSFDGDIRKLSGMLPDTAENQESISGRWGGQFFKNTLIAVKGRSLEEALRKNDELYALLSELERSGLVKKFTSISPVAPAAQTQRENIKRWRGFWEAGRAAKLKKDLGEAGSRQGFSASAFTPFFDRLSRRAEPFPPEELRGGVLGEALGGFIAEGKEGTLVLTEVQAGAGYDLLAAQVLDRVPGALLYNGDAFARRVSALVKNGLRLFALVSLAGSLVLLLLVYRRPEPVLVVTAVLGLDALCSLGILGWLGVPVNLMNNVFILFIFGMCIDYAVFVVSAYLGVYAGREGDTGLAGGAATIAALTTIGGFAALIAAQHPALRSIGLTACVVIVVGLLNAVLLPPLAMRVFLWRNGANGTPTLRTLAGGLTGILFFGLALLVCRVLYMPWLTLRRADKAARRKALQSFLRWCCSFLLRRFPYGKRIYLDPGPHSFAKPAVIVCNHQSVIDILSALTLPADLRMVVKPWVWNSFFMGPVIREAGYILSDGENTEEVFARAADCLREGDFLLFFPEGTRSESGAISRFKKGAFEIAARAGVEILPVVMCETRSLIPKTGFWAADHRVVVSVMPRVTVAADPLETARSVRKAMEAEYERALAIACDGPEFLKRIRACYNYLGPSVESYAAKRLGADPACRLITGLVPRGGLIADLGQGDGLLSNILAAQSTRRSVVGVDCDPANMAVARKSAIFPERMKFEQGNILEDALPSSDTALLIDVLDRWPAAEQEKILRNTFNCLKPGGLLILRTAVINENGARKAPDKEYYLRSLEKIGFNNVLPRADLDWNSALAFTCERPA